ncbi:hypothetical protein HMPREF1624_06931 [Sporothrix schenckii ATCC 58251]|uniref:Uncharacterized protein n=1 Tax=Sporothrix schenckii (strain ATCC 58251 / de Perez 2211183) TaxID=1391915 RepID=U7PMC0_SPOS1|nr:hypothetical protein HMPREF1624_06931 [Sporothrix schenckii ATCC 58251]
MAAMHRPDFETLRQDAPDFRGKKLLHPRDAVMWPYINQDGLSKPRSAAAHKRPRPPPLLPLRRC